MGETRSQKEEEGRACAWETATTQGWASLASSVATGCQGNPCSTGIMLGVPSAARWIVGTARLGAHQRHPMREGMGDGMGNLHPQRQQQPFPGCP